MLCISVVKIVANKHICLMNFKNPLCLTAAPSLLIYKHLEVFFYDNTLLCIFVWKLWWQNHKMHICSLFIKVWSLKTDSHQVVLTLYLSSSNLDLYMLYHRYCAHFLYSKPYNYIINTHTHTHTDAHTHTCIHRPGFFSLCFHYSIRLELKNYKIIYLK